MVEVFSTNITNGDTAGALTAELQALYPHATINFDLDDCDNILRIAGEGIHPHRIISHLEGRGHMCSVLE